MRPGDELPGFNWLKLSASQSKEKQAEGYHRSLEPSYPLIGLSDRFFPFAGLFGQHTLSHRRLFGNPRQTCFERVLCRTWCNVAKSIGWRDNDGPFQLLIVLLIRFLIFRLNGER